MRNLTKALIGLLCFGLLLLGSAYFAFRSSDLGRASLALESVRKQARSHGLPLTAAEIRASIPVPPNTENAAFDYRSLPRVSNMVWQDYFVESPTPAVIADAKSRLAFIAPSLRTARLASYKRTCFFDRRWEDGINILYPEMVKFKNLAFSLCVSAEIKANEGRSKEAFEDIEAAARISKHSGAEPTLISFVMRLSIDRHVLTTTEKLVRHSEGNPRVLQLARGVLNNLGEQDDLQFPLTELAHLNLTAIPAMLAPHPGGSMGFWPDEKAMNAVLDRPFGRTSTAAKAYECRLIEFIDSMWLVADKRNPLSPLQRYKALVALCAHEAKREEASHLFASQLAQSLEGMWNRWLEMIARRQLLKATIGLFDYRNQHHAFPDALPNSEAYVDPLTEEQMHYYRLDPGFVLWSVGPDLVDDEGKGPETGWSTAVDIVVAHPAAQSATKPVPPAGSPH